MNAASTLPIWATARGAPDWNLRYEPIEPGVEPAGPVDQHP
ncbi:MAG TPA: hypothetical protein VK816_04360 [Jatrophihabitantaceae bacterium]|nr:hypothetical protein [Jatrophihabitantaceae bacterium]